MFRLPVWVRLVLVHIQKNTPHMTKKASALRPINEVWSFFEILKALNGLLIRPRNPDGSWDGPLFGYAATAPDGKNFVGNVYADCSVIEESLHAMTLLARRLLALLGDRIDSIDAFLGMPMGGLALAQELARLSDRIYLFPEKNVLVAKTPTSREQADLAFGRHRVEPGMNCVLVEDVVNNVSTTGRAITKVQEQGGIVLAIVCMLNRSLIVETSYHHEPSGFNIPIIALERRQIEEFQQSDAEVATDIAAGNLFPKPKDNRADILRIMREAGPDSTSWFRL